MGICSSISTKWLFINCFQIELEFRNVDFFQIVYSADMWTGNLNSLTLCLSPDVCWENTGHAENLR